MITDQLHVNAVIRFVAVHIYAFSISCVNLISSTNLVSFVHVNVVIESSDEGIQ